VRLNHNFDLFLFIYLLEFEIGKYKIDIFGGMLWLGFEVDEKWKNKICTSKVVLLYTFVQTLITKSCDTFLLWPWTRLMDEEFFLVEGEEWDFCVNKEKYEKPILKFK
jgi:hypothetical protein